VSATQIWFYQKWISAIDIRMKQHVVIEFLSSEGSDGDEIAQNLWNIYKNRAYSRVALFQ
jgi:hypothetical protein